MYRVSVDASLGLRRTVSTLLAAAVVVTCFSTSADARWRKKRSAPQASSSSITYNPQYAAIVVDANSSDILHSANPDSLRHPASLTKIMTLYLLFERLEAGKISLNTQFEVSPHAQSQAPTKLGLRPGQTISVEDAIKALVTKSANDVAVVIAEALAGSEDEFAKLMTRKARALRMSKTVYKNASGLPDEDQVTTARDQALLGLAIQDRFPRYYQYFSTRVFTYKGRSIGNHNRLLGRVEGVDGIKTGYTRMSGFNLVTSVRRGNRHIVAVVLGGTSAGQRDARMRELIEARIVEASVKRTAPKVAEVAATQEPARQEATRPVRVASNVAAVPAEPKTTEAPLPIGKPESATVRADATKPIPMAPPAVAQPAAGSTDPIKPRLVKTLTVRPGATQVASVAPLAMLSPEPITAQNQQQTAQVQTTGGPASVDAPEPVRAEPVRAVAAEPVRAPEPVRAAVAETVPEDKPLSPPPGARPGVLGVLTAKDMSARDQAGRTMVVAAAAEVTASAPPAPAKPVAAPRQSKPRSGWIIQVGAFPDESEAREKIASAKTKASKFLSDAESFTEPVSKGDKTLYRARFAGLKQEQAEATCRYLKQNDFACMAIRN